MRPGEKKNKPKQKQISHWKNEKSSRKSRFTCKKRIAKRTKPQKPKKYAELLAHFFLVFFLLQQQQQQQQGR
jgi:hypothetical protein